MFDLMEQTQTTHLCEACDSLPATISEPCDDASLPYMLCAACHHRLLKRALRPMEWYRLALCHSPHHFLLHSDFYLGDGTADQPKETVVDADLYPAPTLSGTSANLNALWEFTLTRHVLNATVCNAWREHPLSSVIEPLTQAYESPRNAHWKSTVLELATNCLGSSAANLVRRAWLDYPESMPFGLLSKASVACLPAEEGFLRCLEAFQKLPIKEQRSLMMFMSDFKNPQMIDWIEANIQPPITDDWGRVAAHSGIAWDRVIKWLQSGRPLSLVALDSLMGVAGAAEGGRWKMHTPVAGLPSKDEAELLLRAYEVTDAVPRVQNSIRYILERFHFLGPQSH